MKNRKILMIFFLLAFSLSSCGRADYTGLIEDQETGFSTSTSFRRTDQSTQISVNSNTRQEFSTDISKLDELISHYDSTGEVKSINEAMELLKEILQSTVPLSESQKKEVDNYIDKLPVLFQENIRKMKEYSNQDLEKNN